MQPYFFPYLGYFDLINYSNNWVAFDTVQYIRHGWINRNRILNPNGDWQHITIPIKKHSRDILIKDVEISNTQNYKDKILNQLKHYKKYAPYFNSTYKLVEECLNIKERYLSRLNVKILKKVCAEISIEFSCQFLSEMDIELEEINVPGDWALRIAEALGAKEYINPPGGEDLFDKEAFKKAGIDLTIRDIKPLEYKCGTYNFIPGLSIIDILMWNNPDEIKTYLEKNV